MKPDDKLNNAQNDRENSSKQDKSHTQSPNGNNEEHSHGRPEMVTVTLDGEDKTIPAGNYTTEGLIEILGVEPGYLLNVMRGEQLVTLQPKQKVHVKDGMVFISQVPGGASS